MASINRYSLFLLRERKNLLRLSLNENNNQIALMRFSTPDTSNISNTNNLNYAYLHNIEVAKTHRNSRIGSRLLEKMDLSPENFSQTQACFIQIYTHPYLFMGDFFIYSQICFIYGFLAII